MNHPCLALLTLVGLTGALFLTTDSYAQDFPGPATPGNPRQDDSITIRPRQDRTPPEPFRVPDDEEEAPAQAILVRSRFAGWQEANPDSQEKRIREKLRAHWIMVDANGRFEGQVLPGEDADISGMTIFLLNHGRLVKEVDVAQDGRFSFTNIRQGAYGLVGWGPKAFFAFGLNLLEDEPANRSKVAHTLHILAFQNVTTINTDWIRYFAPQVKFRVYGRYPTGEGRDDPPALYGFEGLAKYSPAAVPATSIANQPVLLTSDGHLVGRVHQLNSLNGRPVDVRDTKVMLVQKDQVVASTMADNFGVFEFQDVPEGHFGVIAAGVDGVGMVAIVVQEGEGAKMNDEGKVVDQTAEVLDFCMLPSETIGWLNHYAAEFAYQRALLAPRRPNPDDQPYCAACGGAGCQQCYGTGLCKSKCQSFRDWAERCCHQREKTKLGSGYILSAATRDLRRGIKRSEGMFNKAFYGEGNYDNYGGYGNGGYGGGYGNGGYGNGNGGYGNGGYGYGGPSPQAGVGVAPDAPTP